MKGIRHEGSTSNGSRQIYVKGELHLGESSIGVGWSSTAPVTSKDGLPTYTTISTYTSPFKALLSLLYVEIWRSAEQEALKFERRVEKNFSRAQDTKPVEMLDDEMDRLQEAQKFVMNWDFSEPTEGNDSLSVQSYLPVNAWRQAESGNAD
ncbi:MAG: hypothetical protein L6R41_003903 [Letrouitia leprolyta]|nr:MAG: hypothetical protein L6R41_003903 [Letrouitia leprolyta]